MDSKSEPLHLSEGQHKEPYIYNHIYNYKSFFSLDIPSPRTTPSAVRSTSAVSSPISPEKQAKLREMLGKRKVTPVKSTAPGIVLVYYSDL